MENVLITGGAGFIGFHLAKRLSEKGYSVDIADNFRCGVYDMDLTDMSAVWKLKRDYDYIFHLAAIVGVKNVMAAPYDVIKINIASLVNMTIQSAYNT